MRVANCLIGVRLVAVALCSLALTGCPQLLEDDFKVVALSTRDGGILENAGGYGAANGGNGGSTINVGGGGATTYVAGGTNGTGDTGGDSSGTGGDSSGTGGTSSTGVMSGTGGTNGTGVTGGVGNTGGTSGLCTSGPFVELDLITGLNVSGEMWGPALSADDRSLYFSLWDGVADRIYVATRSDRGAAFSAAVKVTIQGFTSIQAEPFLSLNGLNLYFASYAPQSSTDRNLWVASRADTSVASFSNAQQLSGVNTTSYEARPWLSDDELTIYFVSGRAAGRGDYDIWTATRASVTGAFSTPTNLPATIDTTSRDESPILSKDGLTLYFSSDRAGGFGNQDIWTATRPDLASNFGTATNLSNVNTANNEVDVALSHDEAELFFVSDWTGTSNSTPPRIWRATRNCAAAQ